MSSQTMMTLRSPSFPATPTLQDLRRNKPLSLHAVLPDPTLHGRRSLYATIGTKLSYPFPESGLCSHAITT